MLFGGTGQMDLYYNQPEAVALFVLYRLRLNYGEWFADLTQGMPWATEVLGERTQRTRDLVLQAHVQETLGVTNITQYLSKFDPDTRSWNCQMTIDTIYGQVQIVLIRLPGEVPPLPARNRLGILGGQDTTISMTPANLDGAPHENIADFQIISIQQGRF